MASVDEAGARTQGVRLAEKIIAAALKYFPGRLFDYAILTLRDDERVGEICAKAVTHAESQDVQNPPSGLLAVWRAGDCSCADFRAFTVFPDCRFRRGGANARNELGHLGCDLLSVAFCGL